MVLILYFSLSLSIKMFSALIIDQVKCKEFLQNMLAKHFSFAYIGILACKDQGFCNFLFVSKVILRRVNLDWNVAMFERFELLARLRDQFEFL